MANQIITITPGASKRGTISVKDAANADITANGNITVVSSDPSAVSVLVGSGAFTLTSPHGGFATITTTYTNPSGTITEADTVNPPDPPASISIEYA